MQVGHVAHVHEREPEPRHRWHAFEEALDRLKRGGVVVAQRRADDRARIDHRQSVLCADLTHEVPGGPLGDRLRAHVRGAISVVAVGPVGLGVRRGFRRLAASPDRRDGRGHHDALNPGVERRPENP